VQIELGQRDEGSSTIAAYDPHCAAISPWGKSKDAMVSPNYHRHHIQALLIHMSAMRITLSIRLFLGPSYQGETTKVLKTTKGSRHVVEDHQVMLSRSTSAELR
jgi:hypothetical protein